MLLCEVYLVSVPRLHDATIESVMKAEIEVTDFQGDICSRGSLAGGGITF